LPGGERLQDRLDQRRTVSAPSPTDFEKQLRAVPITGAEIAAVQLKLTPTDMAGTLHAEPTEFGDDHG
jgi:hypothetical protein